MRHRVRRDKRRSKKDKFIFTNDLNLIKPYADYDICIENFISRFGPNDTIVYKKILILRCYNIKIFCSINILDDLNQENLWKSTHHILIISFEIRFL